MHKKPDMLFLHDKHHIEAFLRRNEHLNLYALGALDDRVWENTIWPGIAISGKLRCLSLMYRIGGKPLFIALCTPRLAAAAKLFLREYLPMLPASFDLQLSPGLESALTPEYALENPCRYNRMILADKHSIMKADVAGVQRLSRRDLPAILKCYSLSYPDNWFEPETLDTGLCFGIKEGKDIVSICGIHTCSDKYRIAAIGNITTLPARRGKGLAAKAVSRLCQELLNRADMIGLNVKTDNKPAIGFYKKLGFRLKAQYLQYHAVKRS